MEPASLRTSSANALFVGLVAVVVLAIAFVAFVPVVRCPDCATLPAVEDAHGSEIYFPCERCGYRRRVSLLNSWKSRPAPAAPTNGPRP